MLFARIYDTTGKDDGLQGTVVDIWEADSREELDATVGSDIAWQFVEVSYGLDEKGGLVFDVSGTPDLRGWVYESGEFTDPNGKVAS